jgi:type VI secretion system secreted protein VgrG
LAGSEEVFIQAERDQRVVIANDRREDIGVNESQRIGRDEVLAVAVDETEAVGADHNLTVLGDQSLSVGGKRRRDVAQMETATIGGDHSLRIGSKHSRRIGTDDAVIAERLTEKTGAVVLETSLGDNATTAGMAGSLTVGGALVELAAEAKSEKVRLGRLETIGGVLFSKSGKATASGSKGRFINVGGAMTVHATLDITLDAGLKLAMTSAMASFVHAQGITIKVGGSSIVLSGDTIAITAPSGITIRVTGDNVSGSTLSTQA